MSQPKRYDIDSDGVPYPLDTGDYVRHSDYAALAAENERLRSASFVTAVPSEEYETLKAENERLRNYLDCVDLALDQSKEKAIDILLEWRRKEGDLP